MRLAASRTRRCTSSAAVLCLGLLGWSAPARADGLLEKYQQQAAAEVQVTEPQVTVVGEVVQATPGQSPPLALTVYVPPGFTVYRDMLRVTLVDTAGLSLGAARFPQGQEKPDPADPERTREVYDSDLVIEVPVEEPPAAGQHRALLSVRVQACKETLCLFPKTVEIEAGIDVASAAAD